MEMEFIMHFICYFMFEHVRELEVHQDEPFNHTQRRESCFLPKNKE